MKRNDLFFASALIAGIAAANNVKVSNVMLTTNDVGSAAISFDIAWENSWRYDKVNHDAAWVFFKAETEDGKSVHAKLFSAETGDLVNPSDWSCGTGTAAELVAPADRVGLFVRRAADGRGTLSLTNVRVLWDYRASGLRGVSAKAKIVAHAAEMVYVPTGAYWLGKRPDDPAVNGNDTGTRAPFDLVKITTGDPTAENGHPDKVGCVPTVTTWPNGYNAFYCMKYEMQTGMWCAFYNSLTAAQRTTQFVNTANHQDKAQLSVDPVTGDWSTTRPLRVMGALNIRNCAAFADWSGLRFLTELECVKACRGSRDAVVGEYAWGTSNRVTAGSSFFDIGEVTERPNPDGNCSYAGGLLFRVGAYGYGKFTREASGATYWGVMEMTGSAFERVINISTDKGKAYTGQHGDGSLSATGYADVPAWPCSVANGGTGLDADGSGLWGGARSSDAMSHRGEVSNRGLVDLVGELDSPVRDYGFRAARTAPACAATVSVE